MNVQSMRESRTQNAARMREILAGAEAAGRDLTDEEKQEFDRLKAENERLKASIERAEALEREEADLAAVRPSPARATPIAVPAPEAKREFSSLREFLAAVVFNKNDPRLHYEQFGAEMSMGTGSAGGFAVPKQFLGDLLRVDPQAATVRPRARVIPAGTPPESEITMPALDHSAASGGMYGGVTVNWIAEGDEKPQTDAVLREVSLQPKEVAAHVVVTDKLLRNWGAAEAIIAELLRGAIINAEETAFFTGDGIGRPTGIAATQNAAAVAVNRATANRVTYQDTVQMVSRFRGQNGVWIGSRSVLPQLMQMEDTSGRLVWSPDARNGIPNTLHGFPVIIDDRLGIALGARGDLGLYDLSYYLIKDGSGPFVDASPHVHFTSNKTVIKAFWNVDAKPWLAAPIELEDGTSTASPFVVLDVPQA